MSVPLSTVIVLPIPTSTRPPPCRNGLALAGTANSTALPIKKDAPQQCFARLEHSSTLDVGVARVISAPAKSYALAVVSFNAASMRRR
jgi:hypothetical protein